MNDEAALLRRYALERDDAAFSELVRRTIDFVYASALRQCRGNASLAQDVTQLVFTDLSQRAKSLGNHPSLAGWLHTATRFAAMKILRTENRRQFHERQAAEFGAVMSPPDASPTWTQLQPVLDDAIGELRERDRAALVLRFFQGKSLSEVGASLHISETAARSCVDRALDRLRGRLARRGVNSTAAALGGTLAEQALAAAPDGLASTISLVAIAGKGAAGGSLIPIFAMKKLIATAASLLLVAEFAAATVERQTHRSLEAERYAGELGAAAELSSGVSSMRALPSETTVTASGLVAEIAHPASDEAEEIRRLEQRVARLKARPPRVTDAQMVAPYAMGRATPEAAMQTLTAALRDRDMAALDRFVSFVDDSPENRAAFMANFSEAIRARYQTPERIAIAVSFDEVLRDSPVAQQVLSTHGYSGGVKTVTVWTRLNSGAERQDIVPFELTANGWGLSGLRLAQPPDLLRSRLDPSTGEVLPAKN